MKAVKIFLLCVSVLLVQGKRTCAESCSQSNLQGAGQIININPPGNVDAPNWKQCAWQNLNDGRDSGLVKDCDFVKKRNDSALKVVYDGDWRIAMCSTCCGRWFITFNGAECSGPLPIDAVDHYAKDATNRNHHQHHTIYGYCNGIKAGAVSVGINVGQCAGFGAADLYTGWNSVTRLIVEEVSICGMQ